MKIRKTTALALALAVLLGSSALASTLGDELRGTSLTLLDGVKLARGVYWSSAHSDRLTENYIEYVPSGDVKPVVAYGDRVVGNGSFKNFAAQLEAEGRHVVAGINADYYVMAIAQPLGAVITEGILRSSDAGHAALAFREDGSAFFGWPSLEMTVMLGGEPFPVETFNKRRDTGGYALFNSDFAATTLGTSAGTDVILAPKNAGETMSVNYTGEFVVEEIVESKGAIAIPAGKYILSLSAQADEWRSSGIDKLEPGDEIALSVSCPDQRFIEAQYAVGCFRKLVTNGAVESGLDSERGPRTAVGVKADGSLVLYTLDGRQPGLSIGAGPKQVAERLLELGCVEAGLMDGGGSTGMSAIYIGDEALSQINSPSDGSARSVVNYIMLVTDAPATGVAARLGVTPFDSVMLAGAERQFTVKAADETLRPAPMPGAVEFELTPDLGTITPDGVFTAGPGPMDGIVTARSGGVTGYATVRVVNTPDVITVYDEATWKAISRLDLKRGASLNLYAAASLNHMSLIVRDTCYEWETVGDIGTLDEWGRFTAADRDAEGEIHVTAGDRTLVIPVSVGWDSPFSDVRDADWFYDSVKYAYDEGLMQGIGEGRFAPNSPATRAMVVTILYRLSGESEGAQAPPPSAFSDVKPGAWYFEAVSWAANSGIVRGITDTLFEPETRITREQLCAILDRYLGYMGEGLAPGGEEGAFEDEGEISSWALEAVRACYAAGLIKGRGDGQFAPLDPTSRAELATILMRVGA